MQRLLRAVKGKDDPRLVSIAAELAQKNNVINQLLVERDALVVERDALVVERDALVVERDTLNATKNNVINQLIAERDAFNATIANMTRQISETMRIGGAVAQETDVSETLRARYLDLMEAVLIGSIYEDPPMELWGNKDYHKDTRDRGLDWPKKAYSMIGAGRMRNFRSLVERVILEGVPGDIVETGVWRGGASILARGVLAAYGVKNRRIFVTDSFEGLPPPDVEHYPIDEGLTFHECPELAVSLEVVRENFQKFGLLDAQVVFVKGWFRDTIPSLDITNISVLRLDGDMYESTIIPLTHLYDKISAGGWVIVDDYLVVPACKAAVHDFFRDRKLSPDIKAIDGVGVYFQKPKTPFA
jgi:hypothetical protein